MIPVRRSNASEPNPHLREVPRSPGEGNVAWLARVAAGADASGRILLLGGTQLVDFRLRCAQAHTRQGLTPSLWSHVAILGEPAQATGDWHLHEVSLEPPRGFGAVPTQNGVQEGLLSHYDDPQRWPNIALVSFVDRPRAQVAEAVRAFRHDRRLVDVGHLIVEWLGFCWGAGTQGNPLLAEASVPSAAFVEGTFARLGVDLTPGSSSRASSPEAIWQAARWWHDYYDQAVSDAHAPHGAFCLGQPAAACLFE